jgi:hypothetical protein
MSAQALFQQTKPVRLNLKWFLTGAAAALVVGVLIAATSVVPPLSLMILGFLVLTLAKTSMFVWAGAYAQGLVIGAGALLAGLLTAFALSVVEAVINVALWLSDTAALAIATNRKTGVSDDLTFSSSTVNISNATGGLNKSGELVSVSNDANGSRNAGRRNDYTSLYKAPEAAVVKSAPLFLRSASSSAVI